MILLFFHMLMSSQVVSVNSDVLVAHCGQMNNKADSPVDCFLVDSCENDNIHKDFRKAIGANCIFYSAQTHELIVLVSTQNTHFSWSPHEQVNSLVSYPQMTKWYRGAVVTHITIWRGFSGYSWTSLYVNATYLASSSWCPHFWQLCQCLLKTPPKQSCNLISFLFVFSVYKWNHSKACHSSERHAFPQHPYQAYANVPQRRSHQTSGGKHTLFTYTCMHSVKYTLLCLCVWMFGIEQLKDLATPFWLSLHICTQTTCKCDNIDP